MSGQFLKCDAPGCDHRETIPALAPEHVGKPCPKCGANLCTQEDYDKFVSLSRAMAALLESPDVTVYERGMSGTLMSVQFEDGELVICLSEVKG